MCSDQHVKYMMPRGFPTTSSFLLDYHVKQNSHTDTRIFQVVIRLILFMVPNRKVKNKAKNKLLMSLVFNISFEFFYYNFGLLKSVI